MRIGYIECFSGISGDMLLAALVDAGVPFELLESTTQALDIGAHLQLSRVDRSGIQCAKVDVLVDGVPAEAAAGHVHDHAHEPDEHAHDHEGHSHSHSHDHDGHTHAHGHDEHAGHAHGRNWPQIRTIIEQAGLPVRATNLALRTFALLAEAEARIHNVPVDTVQFHEVGAVDTIVDIVCNAVGLSFLEMDKWVCSPINTGSGFVDCAHGRFPVPAPATAALLLNVPTYSSGIQMELVTPTGAALLRALGCEFGNAPGMRASAIGYGAGTKNPKKFPNALRLTVGDSAESNRPADRHEAASAFPTEVVTVLECAVDDMQPQLIAHCMETLLQQGALDVMCAPVLMKKNRMGSLLTVLCRPEASQSLQELLFRETTTLGIRTREESRVFLDRRQIEVQTAYGTLRIKIGSLNGEQWNAMPEYEDCVRAAESHGVPIKQVMQAALAALATVDEAGKVNA